MVNAHYLTMGKQDFDKKEFLQEFDFYVKGGWSILPEGLRKVLDFKIFNYAELLKIYNDLEEGCVESFRRCNPDAAYEYFIGMVYATKHFYRMECEVDENLIQKINENLGVGLGLLLAIEDNEKIDLKNCQTFFRQYTGKFGEGKGHPIEKKVLEKMLNFVHDKIILHYQQKDGKLLNQAAEMLKMIAYLVKAKEGIHYNCPDEFERISSFNILDELKTRKIVLQSN